jgi:long-chain acyl-CoA synthetase
VAETPDKTAILFGEHRISYAQLDELVTRMAHGLTKMGYKKGDVLSIFLPSRPELIIAYLGAVRAGVTVNLVNALLQKTEVAYILNDCGSTGILTDAKRLPIVEAARSEVRILKEVILLEDGHSPDFRSLLALGEGGFEEPETRDMDLCHLMYTSGTTGWPKGVMATHRNIWHNATEFGKVHFMPKDTIMVATPIFHCWGLVNGTFGMLTKGGTVITVERFSPDQALGDIERLRPSVFQGVPPMYNLLLKQPGLEKRDLSSVRFCLSAATKMPENLIRQVEEKLKWRYAEAWGLTEVSCVGTTAPYMETRIGSCGKGMADAEIKVIDEHGSVMPPGKQGELCVRGSCVTLGYLNKPEATRASFDAEGWFHSGDIATMDEDGYAFIVDRKKDMINVGGEKVFPSEVEDMLINHPLIKDLVIIGIPDELKGEVPKAYVVLKDSAALSLEEFRAYCRPRMAPYKIPVTLELIDEIPRLASGKALRRMLREKEAKK